MDKFKKSIVIGFCFCFLIAYFCVERTVAQDVPEEPSEKQYVDPKGYFKIVPPAQWKIEEYPQDPRGKVAFFGPGDDIEFRIKQYSYCILKSSKNYIKWLEEDYKRQLRVKIGQEYN